MAAKDKFHNHVKQALTNDGWTITDDPLTLPLAQQMCKLISPQKN